MYKKFFLLFLIFSFATVSFAQDVGLKKEIAKFFNFVKERKFKEASKFILPEGKTDKANYDYSDPADKKAVNRICKRIRKYLLISDSYAVGKIEKSKNEKSVYKVNITFKSGSQAISLNFYFVERNGKYLLSKME